MDKGIQCNTLNIYIQELICEIDNLIAEKDDMVEDEKDFRFRRNAKGCLYN